ncbi:hypothetical protein ROT00_07365 [Agromyces mediolanus]|uniref:hypothetical protein n=1 Tax=Agromyces mediolanus TaxID=41986 RepID=UPI0038358B26
MGGSVDSLPHGEQVKVLDQMSDTFVKVIGDADEPLSTAQALKQVAEEMNILVSEAKYGLTYAKTVGRVRLNQSTMRLTTPAR